MNYKFIFDVICRRCEGNGRVAILKPRPNQKSPAMFKAIYHKPMYLNFYKAAKAIKECKDVLVLLSRQSLIKDLETASCPDCNGTGKAYKIYAAEPVKASGSL